MTLLYTQPKARAVALPPHRCRPARKELHEDHSCDAAFDETVQSGRCPVKINYVSPKNCHA